MWILSGLLFLTLTTIALTTVTALLVAWIARRLPEAGGSFMAVAATQLGSLSLLRIWTTISLHLAANVALAIALTRPLEIFWIALAPLTYVFFVCALTLSLLGAMPIFRSLWDDAFTKVALLAVPIVLLYLAKGYASLWLGEVFRVSAGTMPMTLTAATCFLLLFAVAIVLIPLIFFFEIGLLVTLIPVSQEALPKRPQSRTVRSLLLQLSPLAAGDPNRARMRRWTLVWGLSLLTACNFLSCFTAFHAALTLPTTRIGQVVFPAIAFDFDASPADYCDLTEHERNAVNRNEPLLKVLFLTGSQDKGFLVRRQPDLFSLAIVRNLETPPSAKRQMTIERVIECNVVKRQSSGP